MYIYNMYIQCGKTKRTMENHHVQWTHPLFLWPWNILPVGGFKDVGAILWNRWMSSIHGDPPELIG